MHKKEKTPPIARTLLVEDNLMCGKAQQGLLRIAHCQVDLVPNATEALNKIENESPYDFAVVDLGLPDMSGLELARAIRKFPDNIGALPIIILTAHGNEEHKQEARECGCNGFLFKPLSYELCEELVKRFVLSRYKDYFMEN